MKKINATGQPGGAPFNQEDFQVVYNSEIWEALEAMLSRFTTDTEGMIVSGCVISGGGPYDISAGIVYLNGEFMRLPAATGQTLPKYIAPATAVNDDRVFSDTVTRTLFITKSAELVGSAPGAGQYVAITTTTDPDDRRLGLLNRIDAGTAEIRGGIRTKSSGSYFKIDELIITDWDMDTDSSYLLTHNLTDSNILSVSVMIEDSVLGKFYNLMNAGSIVANSTQLELGRTNAGVFDAAAFVDTNIKVTIISKA